MFNFARYVSMCALCLVPTFSFGQNIETSKRPLIRVTAETLGTVTSIESGENLQNHGAYQIEIKTSRGFSYVLKLSDKVDTMRLVKGNEVSLVVGVHERTNDRTRQVCPSQGTELLCYEVVSEMRPTSYDSANGARQLVVDAIASHTEEFLGKPTGAYSCTSQSLDVKCAIWFNEKMFFEVRGPFSATPWGHDGNFTLITLTLKDGGIEQRLCPDSGTSCSSVEKIERR